MPRAEQLPVIVCDNSLSLTLVSAQSVTCEDTGGDAAPHLDGSGCAEPSGGTGKQPSPSKNWALQGVWKSRADPGVRGGVKNDRQQLHLCCGLTKLGIFKLSLGSQ